LIPKLCLKEQSSLCVQNHSRLLSYSTSSFLHNHQEPYKKKSLLLGVDKKNAVVFTQALRHFRKRETKEVQGVNFDKENIKRSWNKGKDNESSSQQDKKKEKNDEKFHEGGFDPSISLFMRYGSFAIATVLCSFGFAGVCRDYENENRLNVQIEIFEKNSSPERIDLSHVELCTLAIIVTNLAVFLAWKRSAIRHSMTKWFTITTQQELRNPLSMILSMFSHYSFIHLFMNMYIFRNFSFAWEQMSQQQQQQESNSVMDIISPPSSYLASAGEFFAFFLSAGVCGGLLDFVIKSICAIPNPSLGASGALMGIIGYICSRSPDSRMQIVFIPSLNFTADSALKGLLAFDGIGVILTMMGRSYPFLPFQLSHAGHLGGLLFGIWYARGGEKVLRRWSDWVTKLWKDARKTK